MKRFIKRDYLLFIASGIMVVFALWYNQDIQAQNQIYFPHPLSDDEIKKYANTDTHAVVIYPFFTQIAYKNGGFYDYFKGKCDTCYSISMIPNEINASYVTGKQSIEILKQLHYSFITDIDVDKNPEILKQYDKVILLHNEYVTKKEFDALKNHKSVLYLYPNAMYAEISVDYDTMKMTLIRGHGYPDKNITNGFNYVTTTNHEYDLKCKNYKWESRPNGMQPTCWPEFLFKSDRVILQVVKDFPNKLPTLVSSTQYNLGFCDYYGNCTPRP